MYPMIMMLKLDLGAKGNHPKIDKVTLIEL